MCHIAYAYQQLGQDTKFADVLTRIQAAHKSLAAQGVNNDQFSQALAYQALLEGDTEGALMLLEQARGQGMLLATRMSKPIPAFAALDGDPRYEKLYVEMLDHINHERAKLELGPIEREPYL